MARSRDKRPGYGKNALPGGKPDPQSDDDDAIVGEIVEPASKLVTPQTVNILIEQNKQDDLKQLLETELNYNKLRYEIIRENKQLDPDAVDHRKTRAFRRQSYGVLIGVAVGLFFTMPFVNLVAAGIFGTIGMIIVCGVMLNARDRELDLAGMLQMIQAILKRRQ